MAQRWHNLLFAHWPIAAECLRALVPAGLALDTFAGQAWVGVVAFRLSGIRLHGCPTVPWVEHFPEVNVRTYVTLDGKPGVFFLSLDTDHRLAIRLARPWFRLPYLYSQIQFALEADGIHFVSQRQHAGANVAGFAATYHPIAGAAVAARCSLAAWRDAAWRRGLPSVTVTTARIAQGGSTAARLRIHPGRFRGPRRQSRISAWWRRRGWHCQRASLCYTTHIICRRWSGRSSK